MLKSAPKNDVAISGVLFAGFTVSVNALVALCGGEDESLASIVMLNCPVCEVVPDSKPLLCKLKLVGRVPE